MKSKDSYQGLNYTQLLELEAELCLPCRRKEWVDEFGANPHAIRAALLRYTEAKCKQQTGLIREKLSPVLRRHYKSYSDKTKIHQLFNPTRFGKHSEDLVAWKCSKELLNAMLLGISIAKPSSDSDRRNRVAARIVRYFFPLEPTSSVYATPPFFAEERTRSDHPDWPHDAHEAALFMVSMARQCWLDNNSRNAKTRLRWFMASGGDLFPDLTGDDFDLWAGRVTAALCFGLELSIVMPDSVQQGGDTPMHVYMRHLTEYWKRLDDGVFLEQYPELKALAKSKGIASTAQNSIRPFYLAMGDESNTVKLVELRKMFPLSYDFDVKEDSKAFAATFLNPWLRFHWADSIERSSCKPQFAAIAFNMQKKTNFVLLAPDSMAEYLKWLSVFAHESRLQRSVVNEAAS